MTRTHVDTDAKTGKVTSRAYTLEEEAAADLAAPVVKRDLEAEIDVLVEKIARAEKLEAALIGKAVLVEGEVDQAEILNPKENS